MVKQSFKRIFVASLVAAWVWATPAFGAYPERSVTILAGYGAGGGVDTLARLYADKLSAALGVQFLVQNKPGAIGTLAATDVSRAAPDGYTLLVAPTSTFTIVPNTRKVGYEPLTDFRPISQLATGLDVIVSSKALPTKDLGEFIALAKANPGKYSYASSGAGGSVHLLAEAFKEIAGIDLLHVPYKSSNDYLTDLIQGRVSIGFDPVLLNQAQAGQLNLMAIIADQRAPAYPDVGTTGEVGLDTTLVQNRLWYGIFAPAGVPEEVVQTLAPVIQAAARDPGIIQQLSVTGIRAASMEPAAFATQVKNDSAYYATLIEKLGLKLGN